MSHGHSHGGMQEEKADIFTNGNSAIGGITSFLSMLFFVARLVDTFGDYEKKFAEMSYEGVVIGFVIALYAAVGSTVCHRALNLQNQNDHKSQPSELDSTQVSVNIQPVETNERSLLQPLSTRAKAQLTYFQKLMLLGDFVGHASDVASPILFILLYAFEMQKYQKAISYAGTFAVGLFSSVASVRTCRNALLKDNNANLHDKNDACDHGHSHGGEVHSHS